jgi:hypothetical protein
VLFIQRGRRGYTDEDLWSFDFYLSHLIGKGLLQLADSTMSHPCQMEADEWDRQLREASAKLLAWDVDTFVDKDAYNGAREGMKWVADNFGDLWD